MLTWDQRKFNVSKADRINGNHKSAVTELAALDPTPRLMQTLMRALNDRDEGVRLQVVLAFEDFEQLEVVPVLRGIAERDPSEEVRDAAADATEFLTDVASRTGR